MFVSKLWFKSNFCCYSRVSLAPWCINMRFRIVFESTHKLDLSRFCSGHFAYCRPRAVCRYWPSQSWYTRCNLNQTDFFILLLTVHFLPVIAIFILFYKCILNMTHPLKECTVLTRLTKWEMHDFSPNYAFFSRFSFSSQRLQLFDIW